jgi:mxaJ protein
MSSLSRKRGLLASVLMLATAVSASAAPLRFCADPDDLPFSNRAGQGFDNRIAVLLAHDLHRDPVFVWARSRRGFIREQFNKGACDVLLGTPAGMKALANTQPYYRSSYVFVTPAREHLQITSFSDPHLNSGRIGLQILEEDYSPPSLPLIRNGHAGQLVGFDSFGDPAGNIVRAVARGQIGTAVVWGPLAGYYAARQHLPVTLAAVSPAVDPVTHVPFSFDITAAVHKRDTELLNSLNASLARLQPQINRILATYHVPTSPLPTAQQHTAANPQPATLRGGL